MINLNNNLESLQLSSMAHRKESEDLLNVLREWALNEELYAKGMERISNHSGLKIAPNTFFEQLRIYTHTLSTKAKKFSENLSNLIINHFKEILTTQSHSVKNTYIEGKQISEYMGKKYSHVLNAMEKYYASCRDCEQVAFDLDKETSNTKKEKIFQKMQILKKEVDVNLDNYKNTTRSFNSAIEKFDTSLEKIINAYNFYEEKRCKCFEESLKILSEIINTKSQIMPRVLDPDRIVPERYDSIDFIIHELDVDTYEGVHPLFQGTGDGFHISVLETSGISNGTKIAVEELYKSEIDDIVTRAWQGENLSSEDYIKFNMRLKEPLGRKAWSWSMNLRRSQGNFKISDKGFPTIVELMQAALNECERTNDINIAKNCIILSQTFYKDMKTGKAYLQNYIIDHSLWKKTDFWESVVNNAIFEELKKQGISNFDDTSHEKHLVFCQLVSFGHIMMSFKISFEIAQKLVNKYAQKYDFSIEETEGIMHAVHESLEISQ